MRALSAAGLRAELSARNLRLARGRLHESTYGGIPSVLYQADAGRHGNFLDASYRAIVAEPMWAARLKKSYGASRRVPRRWDRMRWELDCANSSDALLMNVFCYPGLLDEWAVCGLLGVERGLRPVFEYKPRIPLGLGRVDRTEADMLLGSLLVEAKLTEGSFQRAPAERVKRYPGLEDVFCVDELPVCGEAGLLFDSYQLIRGVLAAWHSGRRFAVVCDARREDLREKWFRVMRAVRGCELRSRLAMVTWQELAEVVPEPLVRFLNVKYGI